MADYYPPGGPIPTGAMSPAVMTNSDTGGCAVSLEPTYFGCIRTTLDALILFEACLEAKKHHVARRPHDRERSRLIRSGSVFVYEEQSSGIRRWTDGLAWSPSRILNNFLIYRELDGSIAPGEKKRASKKTGKPSKGGVVKREDSNTPHRCLKSVETFAARNFHAGASEQDRAQHAKDLERSVVGSLVDSYPFKEGGLVKKTISVMVQNIQHHIVSYYSVEDMLNGRLMCPSEDPSLNGLVPRPELVGNQQFRAPLEQEEWALQGDVRPAAAAAILRRQQPANAYMDGRSASMPNIWQSPGFQSHGQYPQQTMFEQNMQAQPGALPHHPRAGPLPLFTMGNESPFGYDRSRHGSIAMPMNGYGAPPNDMMMGQAPRQANAMYMGGTTEGEMPGMAAFTSLPEMGADSFLGANQHYSMHRPSVATHHGATAIPRDAGFADEGLAFGNGLGVLDGHDSVHGGADHSADPMGHVDPSYLGEHASSDGFQPDSGHWMHGPDGGHGH